MLRPGRFGLFSAGRPGFTRLRTGEVQLALEILPRVVPEIHVLFALPLVRAFDPRFRFDLSVSSAFQRSECLTSLADDLIYYAFC